MSSFYLVRCCPAGSPPFCDRLTRLTSWKVVALSTCAPPVVLPPRGRKQSCFCLTYLVLARMFQIVKHSPLVAFDPGKQLDIIFSNITSALSSPLSRKPVNSVRGFRVPTPIWYPLTHLFASAVSWALMVKATEERCTQKEAKKHGTLRSWGC